MRKFKVQRSIIAKYKGLCEERIYRYSKKLFRSLSNNADIEYMYVV